MVSAWTSVLINDNQLTIVCTGREFHFLVMHIIDDMYVVDEFDAFVLPDSGTCLSEIENVIKSVKKFKVSSFG
jgi:hypothetical protein